MKKYIGSLFLVTLFACGGEDEADTNNANDNNSVVYSTTTTTETKNNFEEVADNPNKLEPTTIEYVDLTHDFGNVSYPSENMYTFRFKNTGNVPLVIESAKASCGCTIPNKPEEPILPGEMGEMDVIFRPKESQQGQIITKKVTVTANTEPSQTYLEISGTVLAPMLDR